MTEREPPRLDAPLFGRSAALWLAITLLCALGVIAIFGFFDRRNIAALEHFTENTAVGDTTYFAVPPDAGKPPPLAATLNGHPLSPVSYQAVEIRDTKMLRVARDAASGLTIYSARERISPQEGEREQEGETFYFLKIAPNAYVKIRPGTPGK